MARTNWSVYTRESGETWVVDGTIPAPNEDLSLPIISTQIKSKTADGDNLFITPSTKYVKEQMEFIWLGDDGTIKDTVSLYIQNGTHLKITDSNGNSYIGKFISIEPIWLVGISPDEYTVRAVFEIMDL